MADLSQMLFVAASTRELTWFFPQRMNNAVMLWAVLNGTVGFLLFWLSYRYFGRQRGITPAHWGVATSAPELARTLALAATLSGFFFLVLFAVYYFFHVDYRFLFMGVRGFQPELMLLLAMYVPFFGSDTDRGRAVRHPGGDRNGLLDGWLAVREPAVRCRSDDVRIAVFQPLFLPHDGKNLSGTDGYVPDIRHDPDYEHGHIPAPARRIIVLYAALPDQ